MTDNILCSGLLSMMVAVAFAAGASLARPDPVAADMPVVTLPVVAVVGKRLVPAHERVAASTAAATTAATAVTSVVQLPPVAVTGRRVPGMEAVTLAQRAADD